MAGVVSIEEYINHAIALNMPAIAITDYNTVASFYKIQKLPKEELEKIKVIYGAEITVHDNEQYNVMILVKNQAGLKNLFKLVSLSNEEKVTKGILEKNRTGLLIGSTAAKGEIYNGVVNNVPFEELAQKIEFYDYLEVHPVDKRMSCSEIYKDWPTEEEEEVFNKRIVEYGEKLDKLVVATSNAHYITKDEKDCHFLISREFIESQWHYTGNDLDFRNGTDMMGEFTYLNSEKAKEIVIENTNILANMCEQIIMQSEEYRPIVIKESMDLSDMILSKNIKDIEKCVRIREELNIIREENIETIYIGILKLLNEVRSESTLVSIEGFISNSYIAYLLGITDIDPFSEEHFVFRSSVEYFKRSITNKRITVNCSRGNERAIYKGIKEVFNENNIYPVSGDRNYTRDEIKAYVMDWCEDIYEDAEIMYNDLERQLWGSKKENIMLNHTVTILPKEVEVTNSYVTEVINDKLVICEGLEGLYKNHFQITVYPKDNITFVEKLIKHTKVNINDIGLTDKKVLGLFDYTVMDYTENPIKWDMNYRVALAGIFTFQNHFIENLLLDNEISSIGDIVRVLNVSKGTGTWLYNGQDLIAESKKTLDEIICSKDDIINYLNYKGVKKEMSYEIAEYVGASKRETDEELWSTYTFIMKQYRVPDWYIDSMSKIRYLIPKEKNILDAIYAVRIAWFKTYYPLEFYSIYFSNFDYTGEKKWVNLSKEETRREFTYSQRGMKPEYKVLHEMHCRGINLLSIDKEKSDLTNFTIENGDIRVPLKYIELDASNIYSKSQYNEVESVLKRIYDLNN